MLRSMPEKMFRVRISKQGRLVIPAELRKEVGITGEDDLVAWVESGNLHLGRREAMEEELWAELAGAAWTVDRFVAGRREEAEREWRQADGAAVKP